MIWFCDLDGYDYLNPLKDSPNSEDRPLSNVYKHLRKMPEFVIKTYFNPTTSDIGTKGSRKGAKGQAKLRKVMIKFGEKFSDMFAEYESLFEMCGVKIAETRAFAATVSDSVRYPSDNLRKAIVRFRKTYVYISEQELSKEKCGNTIMNKYSHNKMKMDRFTHNLGFHLCKKQNKEDFICKQDRFGYGEKLLKPIQKALHDDGTRFYGIINQDNAGF